MANPLEYNHDTSYLPDDCVLKISPSKFSNFITRKHQWYREVVLKEDGFMGSTASVIGTIVHYVAECVATKSDIDKDAIYEYIESSKSIGEEYCALEGTKDDCCIVDYKTYNSKTTPKIIPQAYKYQLLVYAFLLKKNGYNPTRIKLVYINRNIDGGLSEKTGKPLKSYPPEVTVLVESITEEDIEFIGGLLDLCADSVLAGQEFPELLHVIWNDPRLKGE